MCKKLGLDDFPKDPFELRGMLFTYGIDDRVSESVKYIKEKFLQKERLYLCQEFMDYVFIDCFKVNSKEWDKHGGFPAKETSLQFDYGIKQALIGAYKPAFDHLRSCLELTLLTVYFSFEKHYMDGEDWLNDPNFNWKKAIADEGKWFDSINDTPFFSNMLKVIQKNERFEIFENQHFWSDKFKKIYYQLCDYTHIKGYKMGSQSLCRITTHFNNSSFHNTSTTTLDDFLVTLISVVEQIVLLVSLYNPVTLIELPLDIKFGINEPVGFIQPGQSEIVNQLIPLQYKQFFDHLKNNDEEVLGIKEWVDARPDMTQEEIKKQLDNFNNSFTVDKL